MNVLVWFGAGELCNCLNQQHIDMVIDEINKGNHVIALKCDESIGLCMGNPLGSKFFCRCCKLAVILDFRHLLPAGVEEHWVSEYIEETDADKLPEFEYNTAAELRALQYKSADIGLGVMSSYISLTRNLTPAIVQESREYFDALIKEQLLLYTVLERMHNIFNFGLIIFQNGRGAQVKPFLNFSQSHKIDFWCTEDFNRDYNYVHNFWCDYAHSLKARTKQYLDCWETSKQTYEEKEKIARSFFERRRKSLLAADVKVYTLQQKEGLLPDNWDDGKENIVIFNSSEDELAAISREFDKESLFSSQIEGIKTVVEHYINDTKRHFYLRVHPNLKDIQYKYHTDLYKLNYPNLTVIRGDSSISTYTLMDSANKVIVFGSSTGIEATYWGKPVLCLGGSFYKYLNITYNPSSVDEIWPLIETKDLKCLYNENVLKYGYFLLSENHERSHNISVDYYHKRTCGRNLRCADLKTIHGSNFLYCLASFIAYKVSRFLPKQFNKIPDKEA